MSQIREKLEDNERIFELLVDEEVVCTAKTLSYGVLETIDCILTARRKGHATELLKHIENKARKNGVRTIVTSDIDSRNIAAVSFFRKMGYKLEQLKNDEEFLEGRKNLEIEPERHLKILDPKTAVLTYLLEFRDFGVQKKYPYTSLKCIAEACKLSFPKADGILEYLRRGKLVERSFRRVAPPEDVFFQITKKGIKFLWERGRKRSQLNETGSS